MPVYEYCCECGGERDEILPFADFDKPQTCGCGRTMEHKISHTNFTMKSYAKDMALSTLNEQRYGHGLPNTWWKPEAERKAFEGTRKKEKAVW